MPARRRRRPAAALERLLDQDERARFGAAALATLPAALHPGTRSPVRCSKGWRARERRSKPPAGRDRPPRRRASADRAAGPAEPAGAAASSLAAPALRVAQIVLVVGDRVLPRCLPGALVGPRSRPTTGHFGYGWLVASGVAFLSFYVLQALAWWLLLRGFDLHSPFPVAMSTWGKSILARYVPGNVFMFVGRAWMSHGQGPARGHRERGHGLRTGPRSGLRPGDGGRPLPLLGVPTAAPPASACSPSRSSSSCCTHACSGRSRRGRCAASTGSHWTSLWGSAS